MFRYMIIIIYEVPTDNRILGDKEGTVLYVVLCIVKTLSDAAADAEAGDHGKACHVVNKHIL